jgi:glyoxylase-like metal-dependent hydrolase (beta-lactamase superfamily II)
VAEIESITASVWRLRFPIVNAYIVRTSTALALVDTGPLGASDEIVGALSDLSAAPSDVRWIVLTHSHKDHAGSAASLVELSGAEVVAGAEDARVIAGVVP